MEVVTEAKSGDGTIENVGVKLTGKFQCPRCRQKFDTKQDCDLHYKFTHDPNRHQEMVTADLPRLLRTISGDSPLSEHSMLKASEKPEKVETKASGFRPLEKGMSPEIQREMQEMIAITAITMSATIMAATPTMMALMSIMTIIVAIMTAKKAESAPKLPEWRRAHAAKDETVAKPEVAKSRFCQCNKVLDAIPAFILLVFAFFTEEFLAFILIVMACSVVQLLTALGGLGGLLIVAKGSCALLVRMLRAAAVLGERCLKADDHRVVCQSAQTSYCKPFQDTLAALGSQECAVPLPHNVPLGNVRGEPWHGAELWTIPREELQ